MTTLFELSPIPIVHRPPFDYLALRAGYGEGGLMADVQVVNGKPKWGDPVLLSTEAGRMSSALRIASTTRQDPAAIADALLELHAETEGAVRRASIVPDWQEPAPFWQLSAPPFPITALPVPALQRFVLEVSAAYETPVDFAAMGVLAALSGAIGNRRRIHIVGEIYAGACLWIVLIGKPGSGKSDPLEKAMQPVIDLHEAQVLAYLAKKDEYESELAEWENAKKELRGEKPTPPTLHRLLVADHTMEGLALDLSQNPMGMTLYRDELATLLAGFDKYRAAGGGSDRANWLEIWSSKRVDVSRKTGARVIYVSRPFVSIIGTIQPERLQELLGGMDDGFADRLLAVYPQAGIPDLPERIINSSTMHAYREIIANLLAMHLEDDGKTPTAVLTHAALVRFKERGRRLTTALRDENLSPALAGSLAKLRIYASRLTCVLHSACVAAGIGVASRADIEHVEAAWDLVDYFEGHQRAVHAAKFSDPEAARAGHILDLIARKGWAAFTRRQVYMWLPTRFTRPEDTDPALRLLCDHGFFRERAMPERAGRGRPPSQIYDVNPLWDTSTHSRIHLNHKNTAPSAPPVDMGADIPDIPEGDYWSGDDSKY